MFSVWGMILGGQPGQLVQRRTLHYGAEQSTGSAYSAIQWLKKDRLQALSDQVSGDTPGRGMAVIAAEHVVTQHAHLLDCCQDRVPDLFNG